MTTLFAFTASGRGLEVEDRSVKLSTPQAVVSAHSYHAACFGDVVAVGSKRGVEVLDSALRPVRVLALGGAATQLAAGPAGLAVAQPEGGVVLSGLEPGQIRRHDRWYGEAATAVAPADAFTGAADAVLWGTSEGHVYVRYDDNSRPDEDRHAALPSPHDGSILAIAQSQSSAHLATQGGGVFRYERSGKISEVLRLEGGQVIALFTVGPETWAVTRAGRVIALSAGKPRLVSDYDADACAAAAAASRVFVGLYDGRLVSPSDEGFLLEVAEEPIVALAAR